MGQQDIWTILLTYSFVQGFVLSVYTYLRLKKPFLSLLLFAVSVLILIHLYYHFEWFRINASFIFVDGIVWYLIGPFLYFFVRRLFRQKIPRWEFILHLIPAIAFAAYIFPFVFWTKAEKISIFLSVFSIETYSVDINHYLFSAHIFIYVVLAYRLFQKQSRLQYEISAEPGLIHDTLAKRILSYYLALSVFAFFFYAVTDIFYTQLYGTFQVIYLLYSVLTHLIFYFILVRGGESGEEKAVNESPSDENDKYSSSSLSADEMKAIVEKVNTHVGQFEVYRNPDLRLRNVAEALEIPSHHISQSINQQKGENFFDLVNKFRVHGIQENLSDPKYANYTLVGIANEYGFKSASSFYRIFKKYTGKTPKEYVDSASR
ncbi:helix-turn-helix domain-containing protein [Roseivirga sp.]|uniref:helix-turn-helix domain-containing protein n=1 Tax=Roseivirga sp. TaxID=1964215 RepID=UPI003B51F27D